MHPADTLAKLDAAYFSPHMFLGGPGSAGVLLFDRAPYHNRVPDNPGGGTVDWTSPWGHKYVDDIELREDGGTPGFLQAIRAALSVALKEAMGTETMLEREHQLLARLFRGLGEVPGLCVLANHVHERLGIVSFYIDGLHYNLLVKYLSDRYGIQVRGGCSCAGTYGHYLLHVDRDTSSRLTGMIERGDQSEKPGWVRVSVHPTVTDDEVDFITGSIREAVQTTGRWSQDYEYNVRTNEWHHVREGSPRDLAGWFRV
ncbi:MAG: aminotransferase class V-fold PLP-dependent enzyme [Bacillota bacterium]|nr:aminotransferase class V-fold PLP-dependent enzyme [Bacillota bacterium]